MEMICDKCIHSRGDGTLCESCRAEPFGKPSNYIPCKENRHRALTDEQAEWAYQQWCRGYTHAEIAKALNVCSRTINRVLQGRKRVRPELVWEGRWQNLN